MKRFILKACKARQITPLFYAESGSRLWGFQSEDSDYDIRGIHLISKEDYFKITKPKEVIELMEGQNDFVSFSIDKAFFLISKSNPSLLEWFRGDIIYINNIKRYEMLKSEVLRNINMKALYHHYLSMGKQNYIKYIEKEKLFTYKKVLYVLRGLLSAVYIYNNSKIPPLKLENLIKELDLDAKTGSLLKQLLEKKMAGSEKEIVKDKDSVRKIIDALFEQSSKLSPSETGDKQNLIETLNNFSIKIKEQFYT